MHYPVGNDYDPIWRVLASSLGISPWTPLKPQQNNPNSIPLAIQLWYIDFLTSPTLFLIPNRLLPFLESLMPLKKWCSIHARCSKSSQKLSYVSVVFFPSLKQNFIVLLNFLRVQTAFSIFNQVLVGCIPIAALAVHLILKTKKLASNLMICIEIIYWIFKSPREL